MRTAGSGRRNGSPDGASEISGGNVGVAAEAGVPPATGFAARFLSIAAPARCAHSMVRDGT